MTVVWCFPELRYDLAVLEAMVSTDYGWAWSVVLPSHPHPVVVATQILSGAPGTGRQDQTGSDARTQAVPGPRYLESLAPLFRHRRSEYVPVRLTAFGRP